MLQRKPPFWIIVLLIMSYVLNAQGQHTFQGIPEEYQPYIFADQEDVEWFREAKFGVFVHWGPSSLAEVPISWGRYGPRPGAGKAASNGVPVEEYDNLYKRFNPVDFDADEWIRMVKEAGARYFIFTTKHHDGFCMFDANNTEYKITNTPYGKDVAKELADACHKYGIKLFWYYSQPDWHHPDCLTENNDEYREYMYEHLRQLLTDYGRVDGIFFDHLGTKSADWNTPKMLKMVRTLQPGILINQRWGSGMPGIAYRGDYANPEQEIGHFRLDRPWETCATVATAWSWTGGNRIKSYQTCLRMLIQCAGAGGNLALNTGPTPRGNIYPPEKQNYLKIGNWLEDHSESIYETMGGPYKPGPWGVSTRKGDYIYLHVLARFSEGLSHRITLPRLPGKVLSAEMVKTGEQLQISRSDGKLILEVPRKYAYLPDRVVKIYYDGNTEELAPIETVAKNERIQLSDVKASSTSGKRFSPQVILGEGKGKFAEGVRHKGWWQPERQDNKPWLMVQFEKPQTLQYVALAERMRNCTVRDFVIEYENQGKWLPLLHAEQIGMDFSAKVTPVTCRKLRLKILQTEDKNDTPNISKFEVFGK